MFSISRLIWFIPLTLTASGAIAADVTRNDVQSALAAARPGHEASFAGRSLAGLDLRDLDFSGADLSGTDLTDADLRRAKLVERSSSAPNCGERS